MSGGPSQLGPFRSRQVRSAFSLVEAAVSVGVVLVLIGLVVPQLSLMRRRAHDTGQLAMIAQHAALVDLYLSASDETYPVQSPLLAQSELLWYLPLASLGLEFDGTADASRSPSSRFMLSACVLYHPDLMIVGQTESVPWEERRVFPQRRSSVHFPASKGLLWQPLRDRDHGRGPADNAWCCLPSSPPGPIAFVDGSGAIARWSDLLPTGELYIENEIGFPVTRTWDGVRGRDR